MERISTYRLVADLQIWNKANNNVELVQMAIERIEELYDRVQTLEDTVMDLVSGAIEMP